MAWTGWCKPFSRSNERVTTTYEPRYQMYTTHAKKHTKHTYITDLIILATTFIPTIRLASDGINLQSECTYGWLWLHSTTIGRPAIEQDGKGGVISFAGDASFSWVWVWNDRPAVLSCFVLPLLVIFWVFFCFSLFSPIKLTFFIFLITTAIFSFFSFT